MSVKTITIALAAYSLLLAEKRGKESFSKVIKRRLRPAHTARALLESLPNCTVSAEALDHMTDVVESRGDFPAESAVISTGD